jgi:gamma-glutamylcyclotransferase (GGCT)/AIG2-like uncharacterized protein YtfP
VLYFAYGSNLCHAQMAERCPSARMEARAELRGYVIAFGGYSARWGGGVASVVQVHGGVVEGLLYTIGANEVPLLDRFEGVPFAYKREAMHVHDREGGAHLAHVYMQRLNPLKDPRLPGLAYFQQICAAYQRFGFNTDPLAAAIGVEP